MSAEAAALEVRGLRVSFARQGRRDREVGPAALDGVDLEVATDEVLVVVGPSGSGKTTLLRTVAGLETPDAGSVLVHGEDITRLAPGERNLSLVFQDLALLPHLDVAGNIGFGERARGTGRAAVAEKVRAAATALGLGEVLGRRPHELSGGERQRVALARALVLEPAAFLMDEPLSSLDPQLRDLAREDLREVQRRLRVPLVYVTHDPHEALALGDRIAVLRAGRVVQAGTPDAVYSAPVDTFVARFIGPLPMNLLPASDGTLGVRPERLRLVPAGGGRLDGVVRRVDHAGDEATAHVTVAGLDTPVVVRLPWQERPDLGAAVGLSWADSDEHRFDPATGRRR